MRPVPRFFSEGRHEVGDVVTLRGEDARKLTLVLRAQPQDAVEICDSSGRSFLGRLQSQDSAVAVVLDELHHCARGSRIETVLAQAVPKGAKMDFIVEKATELGVARVVPILTERTVGKPSREKVERWRRLARSAAEQSGRTTIPVIEAPVELVAFVAGRDASTRTLLPWELAEHAPLRDRLPELLTGAAHFAVLIGPEGGFSHDEVEHAVASGAHVVSLGPRILRTETAGLVVLSALLYAAGEI